MRLRTPLAPLVALALIPVPAASAQNPPSAQACAKTNAKRTVAPVIAYDAKPGAVRVFAMQLKQDVRHVRTYADFHVKIECMLRRYVVPRLARERGMVNVVAFNEDVGLMTGATGKRGAAARAIMADPKSACGDQGFPCGILASLEAIRTGYKTQMDAYAGRFPDWSAASGVWVAPTDTFARGWMQTFSDLSKRYGVYMLGSNNQAEFRESRSAADIKAFADPDGKRPASVYVATSPKAYNEVFMWGPRDVRRKGPPMLRNVVARNKKVPLTSIEQFLQIAPGPSTGAAAIANVRPYRIPGTKARVAFATSLPAFAYGDPPAGVDPCSDTSQYYMRCLNQLGANVVMQDEANPGPWASKLANPPWQPLDWMRSTWRAAADPTVAFDYNVTPFLVGNLADVVFDGQTAITQRGLHGQTCNYIGNSRFADGEDPPSLAAEAGPKPEFLGIAPWVRPDGSRDELRTVGDQLAPGSGAALQNDYVETAVVADLTFPRDDARPGCVQDPPPGPVLPAALAATPARARAGRPTRFTFTARSGGVPLRYAYVAFAGRELAVDDKGRASQTLTIANPGKYRATIIRRGYRRARVTIRVTR
jgi:hypothetical protein